MFRANVLLVVLWITVSGRVFSSWPSSINGILSSKRFLPFSIGMSTDLLNSVAQGAQMAMDECKDAFKWDRWNCPHVAFSRRYGQPITREVAYARAITAAGIMHIVARNCSRGELKACGCDPKFGGNRTFPGRDLNAEEINKLILKNKDWSWGGCSDHVAYGEKISTTVLDELERGLDVQAYANLHNNLVGRTVVRDTMEKRCKCHGLSGSCTMQVCWMQVSSFSVVATVLKDRYRRAVSLDYDDSNDGLTVGNSVVDTSSNRIPKSDPRDLVYIKDSPDYCRANITTGWPGTKGRACSRSKVDAATSGEKKSCRNICRACGFRVRRQKRQVAQRCNCTFNWCCEVKCDICIETVQDFYCD